MTSQPEVRVKRVPEQRVVAVRQRIEDQAQIQQEIASLRRRIGDCVCGPAVALFLGPAPEGGFDVKIALPVADAPEIDEAQTEILPALHMFSALHVGPYRDAREGKNLRDTVQRTADFINDKKLLIGDDPLRYVYHEGPETHGDNALKYVTEVQVAYHFPVWLTAVRQGVTQRAGAAVAESVMTGSVGLEQCLDHNQIRSWVADVLERLDGAVPDELERACILNACAHHYPKAQLERMRAAYEDCGNVRTFVERLGEDKSLFPGRIWLDEETSIVYIEKLIPPWQQHDHDTADDPRMRRSFACFCPIAREAIRAGEPMSASFCHCSAGWFVQMWEAILDRTVRVEIVTTVLLDDERCVFAVHLPEKLL